MARRAVRLLARHIAADEGADVFVVELAALLHDIADEKFSGSDEAGPQAAREWLARTFAYGGYVRRPLHDPEILAEMHATPDAYRNNVGTTINHFHEKLLLLKDRLHTDSARRIADRRHDFMMTFLHQFQSEWDVAVD